MRFSKSLGLHSSHNCFPVHTPGYSRIIVGERDHTRRGRKDDTEAGARLPEPFLSSAHVPGRPATRILSKRGCADRKDQPLEKRTAGIFESRKEPTAEKSTTGSPACRHDQFLDLIAHRPKLPSSKTPPHYNHDVQRRKRRRTPSQALPDHSPHIVPRDGDPHPSRNRDSQPRSAPGLARSNGHRHERPRSPPRPFQHGPVLFRPSKGRPPIHELPITSRLKPSASFDPSPGAASKPDAPPSSSFVP